MNESHEIQQAAARIATQIGDAAHEHTPQEARKHQGAILEIAYTQGDNEIRFAVCGDLAWLNHFESWTNYTAGYLLTLLQRDPDFLIQGRAELQAAYEALQRHESYQGEIVTIKIVEVKQ